MPFELQELDGRVHQRKQFDSGNSQRDRYLRDLAGQHARLGFSRTFVLVDSGQPSEILGFYTLSAAQIDLGQLSEQEQARLPRLPIPAERIGQLAVSRRHQRKGLGALLIQHAVKRAIAVRDHSMGVYLVVVDADSESAVRFYEHFGFQPCNREGRVLYLALGKGP